MKAWKQVAVAAVAALGSGSVNAALLTFEDGNNGVASSDNLVVTDQYQAQAGVTFYTGTGTDYANFSGVAYLEQMGAQAGEEGTAGDNGFLHDGVVDTVADAEGLDGASQAARNLAMGDFFLRTASYSTDSLVVVYNEPVTWAGFEIWDIDGNGSTKTEEWTITAYNGWDSSVLSKTTAEMDNSVDTTSYDGQSYVVELGSEGGSTSFDRFVIEFTGSKTTNVGLAFNNFSTNSIPEPASLVMLLASGAGIFCVRRVFKM